MVNSEIPPLILVIPVTELVLSVPDPLPTTVPDVQVQPTFREPSALLLVQMVSTWTMIPINV